jgi:nitroreductase
LTIEPSRFECLKCIAQERTSIRYYRPDAVPEAVIRDVFALASRTPSNCNTQPWVVRIASGRSLEHLITALTAALDADQRSPDIPFNQHLYTPIYQERKFEHGKHLYGALGIDRGDHAARWQKVIQRNMSFYGAPHVAFFYIPDWGTEREAADVGMYAQTVMLGLTALGIGSCPQTSVSMFTEPIRRVLGLDQSTKLLFGLPFGYEDTSQPGSRTLQERVPLDDTVSFFD